MDVQKCAYLSSLLSPDELLYPCHNLFGLPNIDDGAGSPTLKPIVLVPLSSEIGIPKNGNPGCPFSSKYTHPDAHM